MQKLQKLIAIISDLINNKFTGYLQLNFFKGGITTINKCETIKPE